MLIELFLSVLDTFCICKSKAFQIQNTRSDGRGNMELKNVKLRAKKTLEPKPHSRHFECFLIEKMLIFTFKNCIENYRTKTKKDTRKCLLNNLS